MLALELFENTEPVLIQALRDFLPIAVKILKLDHVPKIHLVKSLHDTHVPTFGRFENQTRKVSVVVDNRNPVDIIRTLAHELVHYTQGERGELDADSWQTGSPEENQAHEQAGVMMREFDSQFPQYLTAEPVMLPETWTKKYKKSINCSNPKGFSQKAHCAGRKARKAGRKTKSSSVSEAVEGCPPATQDISLNLKNRQKAIDEYHYGPLNPNLPNNEYWQELADKWNTKDIDSVKQNRCGNCGAFDVSKDMQACIAKGIGSEPGSSAMDSVDAGDLGYCKFLKFKCASKRTCDAWIEGGPITEGKRCDAKGAVPELKAALDNRKKELNKLSDKQVYSKIDKIMTRIANTYDLTGQELHDMWTERYGEIPDTYIIENLTNFDPNQVLDQISKNIDQVLQRQQTTPTLDVVPITKLTKDAVRKLDPKSTIGKYFTLLHNQVYRVAQMQPTAGSRSIGTAGMEARHALAGIKRDTIPAIQQLLTQSVKENFADGKKPGRKGLAKRSGVNCKQSVSKLRTIAKNSSGERQRMAHWCANMKAGRNK